MPLSTCAGSQCDMVDTNELVTNEYVPDSQSATVGSSDEKGHSQEDTDINMQLLQEVAALKGNFRFLRKLLDGRPQGQTQSVEYVSAATFSDSISNLTTHIQGLFSQLDNSVSAKLQELTKEQQHREEELRSCRKTADSEIESQWKCLNYGIRCLVYMLSQHKLKKYKTLKKSVKTTLEEISSGMGELYSHQDMQQDICQAYVWRRIYRAVFESKEPLLKPEAMRSLKTAREILFGECLAACRGLTLGS